VIVTGNVKREADTGPVVVKGNIVNAAVKETVEESTRNDTEKAEVTDGTVIVIGNVRESIGVVVISCIRLNCLF
jgi:ACT domain-containing protein